MKVPITQIKLNDKNPRQIRDDKFQKLVQSLKDFPEMAEVREVVVNKEMVILGGNMRFRAMKEAGWKEIPVRIVDWPIEKQQEFIIKDNVAIGDWDWDTLANEWDKELLEGWGLDLINYHDINDVNPEDFKEFDEIGADDGFYHLNIAFDTQEALNEFMLKNEIVLDNNYKKVKKTISIHYPLEERRDVKNVKFE